MCLINEIKNVKQSRDTATLMCKLTKKESETDFTIDCWLWDITGGFILPLFCIKLTTISDRDFAGILHICTHAAVIFNFFKL